MPELPEVQTIVEQLDRKIKGKKIVEVGVLRSKSFKGKAKDIIGKYVLGVKRKAKLLIIELGEGSNKKLATLKTQKKTENTEKKFLLGHLKLTGQLVYKLKAKSLKLKAKNLASKRSPFDTDELPNKYTRVVLEFSDRSVLFFNDLRVFGWLKVMKDEEELQKELKNFSGVDPLSSEFTVVYLKKILSNWGRPVKILLMEQKKLAGIGNIYANEALFCSKIAPHHRGRELVQDHPEKVTKLHSCIKKVLKEGLKYKGSTGGDEAYRQTTGEKGRMQVHLKVYQKTGEACPNKCGKKIRRMTLGGRGTFFCPRCQK